jgi:phytoene/squalene synthetase
MFSPMTVLREASEASHRFVLDSVRETDRDRFLGALFAPEPARRDLLALLAFDHELARTPVVTSEPMLARIRLQWWREAVREAAQAAAGESKPRAQPIVESLSEMIGRHGLDPEELVAVIDARETAVDGPLDAVRTARSFADLELAVLGVSDEETRAAVREVAQARLTPDAGARAALLASARGRRAKIDRRALPVLLPALVLGSADSGRPLSAWRKPLAYWWAARRGRF